MAKYLLLIICIMQSGMLRCQFCGFGLSAADSTTNLDFRDHYLLKVQVLKKLITASNVCSPTQETYCLFQIKVSNIVYCSETETLDSNALPKMKYIIVPRSSTDSLTIDSCFYISVRPSRTDRYLVFNRIISPEQVKKSKHFYQYVVFNGFAKCGSKTDVFEKHINLLEGQPMMTEGEREDLWASEVFLSDRPRQDFKRFTGVIRLQKNAILFDNKILFIRGKTEGINEIFSCGILYPALLVGNRVSADDSTWKENRLLKNLLGGDSLSVTNLEELKDLNDSETVKRFRFLLWANGFANPSLFFIELKNCDADKQTELRQFIQGSQLTMIEMAGWLI